MNAHHMVPEMIQVLQLHPLLLALGMIAEDQIVALHFLHLLQMLAIEVVIHHGRSTVRERPFLVRLSFVPNAARTLRLSHWGGERVRWGRLLFHRDRGLPLSNAALLRRLSFVAEGGHELGSLYAQLGALFLRISQTLANFVSRVTMSIISTVMLASLNFAQLLSTVNSVTCSLKPSKESTKATSITSVSVKMGQP